MAKKFIQAAMRAVLSASVELCKNSESLSGKTDKSLYLSERKKRTF
jgi:hypothetical protein